MKRRLTIVRIILSHRTRRCITGISVSDRSFGIAITSETTGAFHFVNPSNRCDSRAAARDVVTVRCEAMCVGITHELVARSGTAYRARYRDEGARSVCE